MSAFSISEAISVGWDITKKNLSFFILLTIIVGIMSAISGNLQASNENEFSGVNILLQIVIWVVSIFVQMGLIRIALNAVDGKELAYKDILGNSAQFLDFIVASFLYGLIVFGGMILLVIPGIIWAIMFQFYSYYIVDKQRNAIDSLKMSSRLTKGERGHLFLFGLALIGINILGALALVIGLLISVPVTMVAGAYVFRRLEAAHPIEAEVKVAGVQA